MRWPKGSESAISRLFQGLQDIEVFVEDTGDEEFYKKIIEMVLPGDLKVIRVVALDGRANVLRQASRHDFSSRPAIFIVDGDFGWVRGEGHPQEIGVYRFDAYCVENLLVENRAVLGLLSELAYVSTLSAGEKFSLENWVDEMDSLVRLFSAWAVLNEVDPDIKTVGRRWAEFWKSSPGGGKVDIDKVERCIDDACSRIVELIGDCSRVDDVYDLSTSRMMKVDVVSGKDFILPILRESLAVYSESKNCTHRDFRFRLAAKASLERFGDFREALLRTVSRDYEHYKYCV